MLGLLFRNRDPVASQQRSRSAIGPLSRCPHLGEETMWLVLSSVVLASAIGFNILALWLSGCFERKQPEGWNTNPGERLSTFC